MRKTSYIQVRVTPEQHEQARRLAEATDKDISAIVREAIDKLAKRYALKEPQ